jgi:hypothetical protein
MIAFKRCLQHPLLVLFLVLLALLLTSTARGAGPPRPLGFPVVPFSPRSMLACFRLVFSH